MRDRLLGSIRARLQALAARNYPVHVLSPESAAEPARPPSLAADLADQWNSEGINFLEHYKRTRILASLNAATSLFRRSVNATPPDHPLRARYLSNLGNALNERKEDVDALQEAVRVGREAVETTRLGHPERPAYLNNLGVSLKVLYELTGDLNALVEGERIGREAVNATGPDDLRLSGRLFNLGHTLQLLFSRTSDLGTLTEAVQVWRAALAATPDGHPRRVDCLSDLGLALYSLFVHTSDRKPLDEAVAVWREAVNATPASDPRRPRYLNNLGSGLQAQFQWTRDVDALKEAVQVGRETAQVPDPNRPGRLNNLGRALRDLYIWTGDADALAEAVRTSREAVYTSIASHQERAMYLGNLGAALATVFERTRNLDALAEAVQVNREAVRKAIDVDDPELPMHLSNLGRDLKMMFKQTGDVDALTEAVQVSRDAVKATEVGHIYRPGYLTNLGQVLHTLFEHSGDMGALTEAVQVSREAVHAVDANGSDRCMYLTNLGSALLKVFQRTANPEILTEARNVLAEASTMTVSSVRHRANALRGLGGVAMLAGDGPGALTAYEDAIALVPQIATRQLARSDRQQVLGELAGLAGAAASAAVFAGRPERGVELLEQARGVLLAEVLDSYGDLSELQALAPHLAERFERLRDELEASDHTALDLSGRKDLALQPFTLLIQPGGQVFTESMFSKEVAPLMADHRERLAREWDELLAQIRAVPGLGDFMMPVPIHQLQKQATEGPIVMVNAGQRGGEALILTAEAAHPVQIVALPNLSSDNLVEQNGRFFAGLFDSASESLAARLSGQREMIAVLSWLWDEVAGRILEHLGFVNEPISDETWPRVWWCPIGPIAFLPLHAAGHHFDADTASGAPRTVLDRVTSSYTPTIRALRYARQQRPCPPAGSGSALIVSMPKTPNAPPLPGVQVEAEHISALLPGSVTLTGPQATHDAVLSELPHHRIAHLACHGLSDFHSPSSSMLLLNDHATNALTVTTLSRLRLPCADLAYLSACSTSEAARFADEAVHITGAFQLAGYRRVIGTLWPLNDAVARGIAEQVYARLTSNGTTAPKVGQAAHALHQATRQLRREFPGNPALWAAHIHVGS